MKLVIPISEALTMLATHIHSTEALRVKANSGACVTETHGSNIYEDQETTATGISFELD